MKTDTQVVALSCIRITCNQGHCTSHVTIECRAKISNYWIGETQKELRAVQTLVWFDRNGMYRTASPNTHAILDDGKSGLIVLEHFKTEREIKKEDSLPKPEHEDLGKNIWVEGIKLEVYEFENSIAEIEFIFGINGLYLHHHYLEC